VFKAAAVLGFSRGQVKRAKLRIGAIARKDGFGKDARWRWKLGPTHPSDRFAPRLNDEP
jgi:hypothetical protein